MKCPECGIELNSDAVFCTACGAEILTNEQPAAEQAAVEEKKAAEKKPEKKSRKERKAENAAAAANRKAKLRLAGIIAAAVLAVVVIIIIAVNIALAVKANEGRKIFDKVPLGRDIDIVESDTGMDFDGEDSSEYGAFNHIADYDYLCESDDSVEVGGLQVPEWAIALNIGYDENVNEAVLYNFNAIKHNWMGEKTATEIDLTVIEFGTKIKNAERSLGLKPYTIIKELESNTSVYVYRYHYVDDETDNTMVINLYVTVDDVDGTVTFVESKQVDYMKLILQAQ